MLLASPPAAPAATSSGAKEKELRELRGRIEALQKRLADAEESKSEAVDALKESERAISDANRSLRGLGEQSRGINRRLAELRGESQQREEALKSQQELLARQLYQNYLGGRAEPLKLLLNREDPDQIARHLHYFAYISRARVQLISELRASLSRLRELAHEAEQNAAELAAVTREQHAQRQRLEREKRARAQVLARISRDIQRQRREIGTLRRDETRLARLVEQLSRLVARERPAPRLRNERVPDASTDGDPFQELKGRLSLPVRGELANRFGSPRSEGGAVWKGLFIAAKAGEEVRAVAAGRVVFADWLRGFGNLLIIDHGGAYMSLYGNNEALYKQVGEVIRGGEPIAIVGNSGGNADSGLYFELRHQGKPLDPLTWVGIE
ncbi:MAG: peptidoglycan DD-metalloendopeptidase family protein [Betaproteobacteria bacterium]|nr:peptidoglycan DD-metalloendopeptidase family protein [Betaproteobacteria bacterium]